MKSILRTSPFLLSLGLSGFALTLSSCGFKDNPVPPQNLVPAAIEDLRCQLKTNGATLSWTYPQKTVNGRKLARISSFKLYRAVVPANDYCKTCPIPFGRPVKLDGGALPDDGLRGGAYQEPILRPGNLYFYKIRSDNGWGAESADSNVVSFLWETPAAAPEKFTAAAGDGKNTLNWSKVTKNQDGSLIAHPVRYQLFRKTGEAPFIKLGQPLEGTRYVDKAVQNNETYSYQVQAMSVFKEGLVEGARSEVASATPLDKKAPPAPETPSALMTSVGTKVFWNHVEAEDLAGYRVYRRSAGDKKAALAGQVNLPYNMFIDTNMPKGTPVFYSVSTIDSENPPNESRRSAEVRAEE